MLTLIRSYVMMPIFADVVSKKIKLYLLYRELLNGIWQHSISFANRSPIVQGCSGHLARPGNSWRNLYIPIPIQGAIIGKKGEQMVRQSVVQHIDINVDFTTNQDDLF